MSTNGEIRTPDRSLRDPRKAALMRGVVARHALGAEDAAELVAMLGIGTSGADGGEE